MLDMVIGLSSWNLYTVSKYPFTQFIFNLTVTPLSDTTSCFATETGISYSPDEKTLAFTYTKGGSELPTVTTICSQWLQCMLGPIYVVHVYSL
jgi:hypothetical protein